MKIYALRHGETTYNASDLIVGRSDVPLTEKGEQQARDAVRWFARGDPSTTLGVTDGAARMTDSKSSVTGDVTEVTSDVILSERSESKNLLRTTIPEVIFASPLIRAQKTAQIVNEELLKSGVISKPLAIITEPRLIEQDYGKLEGQSRYLEEFAESKKQFADFTHVAESQLRLAARVYAFLDELKAGRPFDKLRVTNGAVRMTDSKSSVTGDVTEVTSDVILSEQSESKNLNAALLVTHGGICRIIHTYFNSMTIEEFAAWRAVNCEINEYEL